MASNRDAALCRCGLHNDRETACTCDGRYDLTLGDIEEQEAWQEHTRQRVEQMTVPPDREDEYVRERWALTEASRPVDSPRDRYAMEHPHGNWHVERLVTPAQRWACWVAAAFVGIGLGYFLSWVWPV